MIKLKSRQNVWAVVGVCLLLFPVYASAQKVKIEQKDGVKIIKNPKKPVLVPGGPKSLTLIEELCLGEEPSPEYMFEGLRSIHVDNDKDMIVLDWGSNKILIFDKNGRFVRSFGNHGQGPGELQAPSRMYLKSGKDICIMDSGNNRIAYYSKEGECLREIQMVKYRIFRSIPDSRGYIYGDDFIFDKQIQYRIIKLDPEHKLVQIMAEFERPLNQARDLSPVMKRLTYSVTSNDQLAWALTSEYAIHFIDPAGKHVRTITKDYDRVSITSKQKELIIEEFFGDEPPPEGIQIVFPKHFYPMYYFLCDDRGRIFVRTYVRNDEKKVKWDVFDEKSRFILSFFHPGEDIIMEIKENKAYAMIQANEEGLPLIKRYQLNWK